jgi:hypothetical protein
MNEMLRILLRRRTAYLPIGLVVLCAAGLALASGPGVQLAVERLFPDATFSFALMTGIVLLGAIAFQWRLYWARRSQDGRRIRREYNLHRWAGLSPLFLLILHIGGPEATLMSVAGYALLGSSLVGLFNREIVPIGGRAKGMWLATHIGLAAFVIPLVLIHMWAVLAFKVN